MSDLSVERGDDLLRLGGKLDKNTVPQALKELRGALTVGNGPLSLDLSKVTRADSAGIAMLLYCMRQAKKRGREIRFLHVPEQMLAIARVSGLDHVLPLGNA